MKNGVSLKTTEEKKSLQKGRIMKIKKLCSLILAMVLVLTLFAGNVLNSATAAETSEKQMLCLAGTSNWAPKFGMMVPSANVTLNESYTVRFKYRGNLYETDTKASEAGATDYALFSVFYKEAESGGGRMQFHIGASKPGSYIYSHITESTAEFTFKITASTLDNYYVGFYLTGVPTIYVADMEMFKTNDDSQTNILPEAVAQNWSYLPYGNATHHTGYLNSGSSYMAYNAEYFPESNEMLHLSGSFLKVGAVVPKARITTGENYTVRFKYKGDLFESNAKASDASAVNSAVFSVFYKQAESGGGRMQYHIGAYGAAYTQCNITENTAEYQFNITADAAYYYVGFFTAGNPDLYIADMVMYKTSDVTKTNILPEKSVYNWRYLVGNDSAMRNLSDYYSGVTASAYETRNEEYFALEKQMLHFNYDNVSYNRSGIKVSKDKLLQGNYTVEFKYKFKTGNIVYSFDDLSNAAMFGVFYHQATSGAGVMQYLRVPGASGTYEYTNLGNNTISYTFLVSKDNIEACIDDFYIGFMANGSSEFYVSDMIMYKTTDTTKTNILSEEYWVNDWKQGSNPYYDGLPSKTVYEDYDETIFDIIGDGNKDGRIDICDLVYINNLISESGYQSNLDIDKSETVDSDDLALIRQHLLGTQLIA